KPPGPKKKRPAPKSRKGSEPAISGKPKGTGSPTKQRPKLRSDKLSGSKIPVNNLNHKKGDLPRQWTSRATWISLGLFILLLVGAIEGHFLESFGLYVKHFLGGDTPPPPH